MSDRGHMQTLSPVGSTAEEFGGGHARPQEEATRGGPLLSVKRGELRWDVTTDPGVCSADGNKSGQQTACLWDSSRAFGKAWLPTDGTISAIPLLPTSATGPEPVWGMGHFGQLENLTSGQRTRPGDIA